MRDKREPMYVHKVDLFAKVVSNNRARKAKDTSGHLVSRNDMVAHSVRSSDQGTHSHSHPQGAGSAVW